MQMLQQIFGVDGAKYVAWLLTALAIIVLALFVWWLIRKALGDRINMSDRPDRRGRPPRLGVTESFTIGPQGRRLIMVRRDNVEHLLMVGGPNDVVIETNVVRGERLTAPRPEIRMADAELAPVLPDPLPVVRPAPAMIEPKPAQLPRAAEPAPQPVARLPEPPPIKAAPPPPPPVQAAPPPLAPPLPPVQAAPPPAPKAPESTKAEDPAPAEPAPPKSGMTLAERLKAGIGRNSVAKPPETAKVEPAPDPVKAAVEKSEAVVAKVELPKVELPKVEMPKVELPKVDVPAAPSAADMKAKLEEVIQTKLKEAPPQPAAPAAPLPPPAPPPPKAAAPSPPPAPKAAEPPPPPPPAKASSPAPAAASKNPFDSLEEEMARLLGRAPDGKG